MATDDLKAVVYKARASAIRLQAKQVKDRAQYTADIDQAIADDVTAFFAARIEALEVQLAERDAERELLMEAVVLLDNGNGIPDDARYSFVDRAASYLRGATHD